MDNKLQIFNYDENEIRTVEIDGEPWFVAKDVANVLGYTNPRKAIVDHIDDEDKGVTKRDTPGGTQEMTIINESGVLCLVLSSKLPNAKAFKHWITKEVIPSIRKTGSYALMPKDFASALRAYADEVEKNEKLAAENKILKPKAGYFDVLVDRQTNINFRDTAKEFHMGQKEFITFLLDNNFIYRDAKGQLKPYMQHVEDGLFVIKEGYAKHSKWSGNQTLITPKGRTTFKLLLGK